MLVHRVDDRRLGALLDLHGDDVRVEEAGELVEVGLHTPSASRSAKPCSASQLSSPTPRSRSSTGTSATCASVNDGHWSALVQPVLAEARPTRSSTPVTATRTGPVLRPRLFDRLFDRLLDRLFDRLLDRLLGGGRVRRRLRFVRTEAGQRLLRVGPRHGRNGSFTCAPLMLLPLPSPLPSPLLPLPDRHRRRHHSCRLLPPLPRGPAGRSLSGPDVSGAVVVPPDGPVRIASRASVVPPVDRCPARRRRRPW